MFHDGLHKHRVIQARDADILRNKARVQAQQWDDLWRKQSSAARRVQQAFEAKEAKRLHIENQKEEAADRTAEAQSLLEALRLLLAAAIGRNAKLTWDHLKIKSDFPKARPEMPAVGPPPPAKKAPPAPDKTFGQYQPKLGFLDKILASRRRALVEEASRRFEQDLRAWEQECGRLAAEYEAELAAYRSRDAEIRRAHSDAVESWEKEKAEYFASQAQQHAAIDSLRQRYEAKDPEAIVDYCETVIANSDYPDCVSRDCEFEFNPENGVLIADFKLPAPDDLPTLTEVKYTQSSDALTEKHLSDAQQAKLYDDVLYQIVLRTVQELFQSDEVGAIVVVVFNGIVTSTDKSTGKEVTACILSLQASRDTFEAINLAKVDPKACFRQLKGVGSSKLHSITPVAPIMQMCREDRRFIQAYGVADQLREGSNLAAMDWEDFEHLIREIFEKEFSSAGGEVRVTQASRDGGVDAVVFDPDPIRGGKIVIQAKRYAHTVGVAAVRDLYGTVMNEGATKGILVTTSDYGPDAYEFANGKPLTLLSGSHLLHLLGKHGVQAHIDLVEARQLAQQRSNRE
jgi:restriction system protein